MGSFSTPGSTRQLTQKATETKLMSIYKSLQEFGFGTQQIEQSIRNLPAVRTRIAIDVSIDYSHGLVPVELPLVRCCS